MNNISPEEWDQRTILRRRAEERKLAIAKKIAEEHSDFLELELLKLSSPFRLPPHVKAAIRFEMVIVALAMTDYYATSVLDDGEESYK